VIVIHKEREILEFKWIYRPTGSGKIEFSLVSLKTYDLMRKQDFVYTGLGNHKNIIYENATNHERLEYMMKMFSGCPLVVKIPYVHYNFLPTIIYITYEFNHNYSAHIIENMRRRMGIVICSSK
jgi:hypothetical protein